MQKKLSTGSLDIPVDLHGKHLDWEMIFNILDIIVVQLTLRLS